MGVRPAYVVASVALCSAVLGTGCNSVRKLRVVGDPCEKAGECQSGLCDEFRNQSSPGTFYTVGAAIHRRG